MNRKTILIIDPDRSLCTAIQHIFTQTGANISVIHDEIDSMSDLNNLQPDLIIIDVELSATSGFDFLHSIRRLTSVPVIVVTGIDDRDQSRCLDAGADDVVTKPFNMDVLLARVKATLRRAEMRFSQRENAIYDDGNLVVDPVTYQVIVRGSRVKLTPTEFKLLNYLINNAGESCTFSQILESIWGDGFKNNREYVHAFIWQLRQKLERDPKKPDYILSMYDIGYRFQAHQYGELERLEHVL